MLLVLKYITKTAQNVREEKWSLIILKSLYCLRNGENTVRLKKNERCPL